MKKTLFLLLMCITTGTIFSYPAVPLPFQVVKPAEDIKTMYEEELYKEIIDKYAVRPRSLSATDLTYIAQSYLKLEDLESATIFAQMATQKDPRSASAYYVDGIVSNMIGNPLQAEKQLKKAIGLSPNESDYYIALGDVYYAQEQYNEALEEYKKATNVTNPSEKAYYMVGVAYMSLNDEKRGLEAFYEAKEKAVKDKELYVTVLYNIGKTEYDNARHKIALMAYNELVNYLPDDYYSYEKMIQCNNALQEYQTADKYKLELYNAHALGRLDGTSLADMYGIEDFRVGSRSVCGYERYQDKGEESFVKNIFYVQGISGNIESTIYLEYTPVSGNKMNGNIIVEKGGERYAGVVKFNDRISYPTLRQTVADIISGQIEVGSQN